MNTLPMSDCHALPQVAMPFMNTVHSEELALVNHLLKDIKAERPSTEITEQINAWHDHTVAHFQREERYMRECNFPPYSIHKSEHDTALQQLSQVRDEWLSAYDYQSLESYIVNAWRPWLDNHIGTLDFVTAHFFQQCGITVEL